VGLIVLPLAGLFGVIENVCAAGETLARIKTMITHFPAMILAEGMLDLLES